MTKRSQAEKTVRGPARSRPTSIAASRLGSVSAINADPEYAQQFASAAESYARSDWAGNIFGGVDVHCVVLEMTGDKLCADYARDGVDQ